MGNSPNDPGITPVVFISSNCTTAYFITIQIYKVYNMKGKPSYPKAVTYPVINTMSNFINNR